MTSVYTPIPAAFYGHGGFDPFRRSQTDESELDVVIRPSAPADPRLMALIAGIITLAGVPPLLMFWRFGAWPVTLFFALDALLIAGAFRLALRRARYQERLRIGPGGVDLVKTAPSGKRAVWSFPVHQVRIDHDPDAHANAQLGLVHQGGCVRFAACLTPKERQALARTARAAIVRCGGLGGGAF